MSSDLRVEKETRDATLAKGLLRGRVWSRKEVEGVMGLQRLVMGKKKKKLRLDTKRPREPREVLRCLHSATPHLTLQMPSVLGCDRYRS